MTTASSGYGRFDLWRDSAAAGHAEARELAGLLELRASDPEQERTREAYLELVGVAAGARVLDVGCGSGAVTRALARRVGAAATDHLMVDGWLARRLPALLADAGLADVAVRAFTPVERDPAGFAARMAERRAATARQAGLVTEDEQRRWLDALHAEQAAGRFLGGQTHLFVWGTRPR